MFIRSSLCAFQALISDRLTQTARPLSVEAESAERVRAHHAAIAQALSSVNRIGPATLAVLLAEPSELGRPCRQRISALVDIALLNRESGQICGQRTIWRGCADLRRTLYMATLAAVRHSAVFKAFYARLVAAGKPNKVAWVAAMRAPDGVQRRRQAG